MHRNPKEIMTPQEEHRIRKEVALEILGAMKREMPASYAKLKAGLRSCTQIIADAEKHFNSKHMVGGTVHGKEHFLMKNGDKIFVDQANLIEMNARQHPVKINTQKITDFPRTGETPLNARVKVGTVDRAIMESDCQYFDEMFPNCPFPDLSIRTKN